MTGPSNALSGNSLASPAHSIVIRQRIPPGGAFFALLPASLRNSDPVGSQFASYSVLAVTMIFLSLFVCLILVIRNEQEVMKSESRNSARTLGEVNLVWVHRVLSP
jgi:hypothetical protein